jgi:hypothetical protein
VILNPTAQLARIWFTTVLGIPPGGQALDPKAEQHRPRHTDAGRLVGFAEGGAVVDHTRSNTDAAA